MEITNKKEKEILQFLVQAWNKFVELENEHPQDTNEFCTAIHDAQKIIALRVARRVDPETWYSNER